MTDRLSATDAAFLYAEDAGSPMHVGGVVILAPDPARESEFRYADIVNLIQSRLALVPRYRQRVRFVPGRLARPVWVDDENFDITYHVRRSALTRPGTQVELDELVGRLISRPLDRDRPLWEVYVVEGLTEGRIALVNKTHHAMVDRVGAVDVAAAILDVHRRPRDLPDEPWLPNPAPSDIDLVVDAVADLTTRPGDLMDIVRFSAMDVRSAVSKVFGTIGRVATVVHRTVSPAPQSLLNVTKSGQRRFSSVSADLARFKRIRRAHGASVNDVILTVVTGALRGWLLSRGQVLTPHTVVRAMVPMSVRSGANGSGRSGNGDSSGSGAARSGADGAGSVASYLIDLPVAEPNPAMRLHQVSFAMGPHLEGGQTVGADALISLGRFAPPTLHAMGARLASQLSGRSYNLLITNVPGPQVPLYAAGFPVEAMYPVAPLAVGHALAVSCTSYNREVFIGITADREAITDAEDFSAHIIEALEELEETVPHGAARWRKPRPVPTAGRPPGDRPSRLGSEPR